MLLYHPSHPLSFPVTVQGATKFQSFLHDLGRSTTLTPLEYWVLFPRCWNWHVAYALVRLPIDHLTTVGNCPSSTKFRNIILATYNSRAMLNHAKSMSIWLPAQILYAMLICAECYCNNWKFVLSEGLSVVPTHAASGRRSQNRSTRQLQDQLPWTEVMPCHDKPTSHGLIEQNKHIALPVSCIHAATYVVSALVLQRKPGSEYNLMSIRCLAKVDKVKTPSTAAPEFSIFDPKLWHNHSPSTANVLQTTTNFFQKIPKTLAIPSIPNSS